MADKITPNDYLDDAQLQTFRERLLAMREEYLRDFAGTRAGTRATADHREVGDAEDRASQETSRELGLLLEQHDRSALREIDDALRRIANGTYGICEESEERIPVKRLERIPTARYTVEVQEEIEREQAIARERNFDEEDSTYRSYAAIAEEEDLPLDDNEED